jgi:hypothetical protein
MQIRQTSPGIGGAAVVVRGGRGGASCSASTFIARRAVKAKELDLPPLFSRIETPKSCFEVICTCGLGNASRWPLGTAPVHFAEPED